MKLYILLLIVLIVVVMIWINHFLQVENTKKELRPYVVAPAISKSECQPPPMTGRLKITTDDTKGNSNCGIRLGDIYVPIVGQPFSATWNDAKLHDGGYILSWGPTGLFYGLDKARMFEKNLTVVTQKQFEEDGKGFAISRGGVIPCECCGEKRMLTPFTVTPIRKLHKMKVIRPEKVDNVIHIEIEPNPDLDTYIFTVKIRRDSTLNQSQGVQNFAYHGTISANSKIDIILPSYIWSDEVNFGQYSDTYEAQVFGCKSCDVGNPSSVRAGNLALFAE